MDGKFMENARTLIQLNEQFSKRKNGSLPKTRLEIIRIFNRFAEIQYTPDAPQEEKGKLLFEIKNANCVFAAERIRAAQEAKEIRDDVDDKMKYNTIIMWAGGPPFLGGFLAGNAALAIAGSATLGIGFLMNVVKDIIAITDMRRIRGEIAAAENFIRVAEEIVK